MSIFDSSPRKKISISCHESGERSTIAGFNFEYFLLVGVFFFHPSERYAQVKLDENFPKFRNEHKKYLSCHHPVSPVSGF